MKANHLALLALGGLLALLASVPGTVRPASDVVIRAGGTASHEPHPGSLRVVLQPADQAAAAALIESIDGTIVSRLDHVAAIVADVPAATIDTLRDAPAVGSISLDRPMIGTLDLTSAAIGAGWVHENLGFDGTGIGVAIIDSGVAASHRDLEAHRIVQFVDFVRFHSRPHDGYGHGTHVAGIIAGSGHGSGGATRGVAPGVHLMVLKTLDEEGRGYISNAIAAIDYAIGQRTAYNIRVINLSVAAGVYESYRTDPLALAAARAVDAGIVVVTAAGNLGRSLSGEIQHGGVTAPGNAPWVLTVGAASHNGTADRSDDTVAPFSSLGPSSIDHVEKPDLVAPGTDIASMADPGSTLFLKRPAGRRSGAVLAQHDAYLSLSGTSMAAPVVAGAAAVMLHANAALSPAAVKAVLQATAEPIEGYSRLAQGAGLLNMRAAVALAARLPGDVPADPFEGTAP